MILLNCNIFSQYYCFYSNFVQINATLVSKKHFIFKLLTNSVCRANQNYYWLAPKTKPFAFLGKTLMTMNNLVIFLNIILVMPLFVYLLLSFS